MSKNKKFSQRAIHLVDIENQLGAPQCGPQEVKDWFDCYSSTVAVGEEDIVVIGVTNIHNIFAVKMSGVQARIVHKLGPDGANIALQSVMKSEDLGRRFGRIYCVSGDGGFAEQVGCLGSSVPVLVVVGRGCLARRLQMAAGAVIHLPDQTLRKEAATTLWPAG